MLNSIIDGFKIRIIRLRVGVVSDYAADVVWVGVGLLFFEDSF